MNWLNEMIVDQNISKGKRNGYKHIESKNFIEEFIKLSLLNDLLWFVLINFRVFASVNN